MKYLIIGPPRSGKSTYARRLREEGIPTFCTDPQPHVKEPEPDVTYAPALDWSACSQYVADHWIDRPGPWCIEGVGSVRALRKFLVRPNADKALHDVAVIVFERQLPEHVTKPGQSIMAKSVATVWSQIRPLVKDHICRLAYPNRATKLIPV